MGPRLRSERFPPEAGLEPVTARSVDQPLNQLTYRDSSSKVQNVQKRVRRESDPGHSSTRDDLELITIHRT